MEKNLKRQKIKPSIGLRWFGSKTSMFKNLSYLMRWVKDFFHRGLYGYAESDVWNMDNYLLRILPPMLYQLKKETHGYPAHLTAEQWDEILDKMIEGFESYRMAEDRDSVIDSKEHKKLTKSLELLKKHFLNLWD
jgi:hypothetical protein